MTSSVRVWSRRRTQSRARNTSQRAAPRLPARCGRPLGEVHALAQQHPPLRLEPGEVHPEPVEPLPALRGQPQPAAAGQHPPPDQRVVDGDPEPPGEVVVAGARGRQARALAHRGQRARRRGGAEPAQQLDQLRDLRPGETDELVPPLGLGRHQPAVHQPGDVLARGGPADRRRSGQLGDRPGARRRASPGTSRRGSRRRAGRRRRRAPWRRSRRGPLRHPRPRLATGQRDPDQGERPADVRHHRRRLGQQQPAQRRR